MIAIDGLTATALLRISVKKAVKWSGMRNSDPLAKAWIGIVADLHILARIQNRFAGKKRRNRIVIEASAQLIFPSGEVGHPVRNIDIDAIDAGGPPYLADPFHI